MSTEARDALFSLDPGMAREQWVRVAFAFRDAGGTVDDWLAWCGGGGNFNLEDATTTFRNAKPRAGGVTSATLYMMARDSGWKPEKRAHGDGGDLAPRPAPKPREPEPEPVDPLPAWNACHPVELHGYLKRKGIKAHGARVNSTGSLVVPYWNRAVAIQTLQMIAVDGTKRFLAGARQRGSVAILGEPRGVGVAVVVVGEGFATVAAIEEATGYPALAAGSRVTMPEACRIAREFAPNARIVVAADRGDITTPIAAARGVAGFLCAPGPEDAPDGFDFCDWRLAGATDAEIRARIDRAPSVSPPPDTQAAPTEPQAAPNPRPRRILDVAGHVAASAGRGDGMEAGNMAAALAVPMVTEEGRGSAWMVDGRGKVLANVANVSRFLAAGLAGDFALDTITGSVTWRGKPVEEVDYVAITCEVQRATVAGRQPFGKVPVGFVVDGIGYAAHAHAYNSNVRWLDTLPAWDGVERVARFFIDALGVEADDYALAVGRYFWRALLSRMVTPGAQCDATVCLVGPQGIGKSRLARAIGGERYGAISLSGVGERDWSLQLRGKILVEIEELSGHSRAELEALKAAMSRCVDEYRVPYARAPSMVPRTCIMMGTTNEREFLSDASGNRRWLPMDCDRTIALDYVQNAREQLFAEAFAEVRAGLPSDWWHVPGAEEAQAAHLAADPWIEHLSEKLLGGAMPVRIMNADIYAALDIPPERRGTGSLGRRIAAAMRALGYQRERWEANGVTLRGFSPFVTDRTDA